MYTPKYVAILDQRRSLLREHLDAILRPGVPFVLEVGCGHGHFLTAYAQAHPTSLCLGIDIVAERIERAVKKRDRAKLTNLHFIQAEARLFIDTLPADARISEIFVLFPDPWPKLRHNKHRIIQPSFLEQAASRALSNAPLYFRTDFTPYFEATRDVFAGDPYWQIKDEAWPFEFETVFQQRAPVFHSLIARRNSNPVHRSDRDQYPV